mgnify:CR=1 FL=1
MKKWNIWKNVIEPLELHENNRGRIVDVFYKSNIKHAAIVDSKPNVLRGDHYHKDAKQHMLMIKGGLEYWYKHVDSIEPAKCEVLREGDIVTTPPFEVHALKILPEGCQFIAFSEGLRGGKDYESDTFRVSPTIIP